MRRTMADAILKSYRENAKPNLPDGAPDETRVPLLVGFTLGDLRQIERIIAEVDNTSRETTRP